LALLVFDLIERFCIPTLNLWDIQKNIGADVKEALNIEEIKNVKKRNKF
tara:strand:- start:403 stop:549 length:147 start_codon:yes stop_codon:yes gene_type:complete